MKRTSILLAALGALGAASEARAGCYVPGDYDTISHALLYDCTDITVDGASYSWTKEPTTYLGLYESVTIRGDGVRPRLPTIIVKGYLTEIRLEFVELGASDGLYDPYSPAFKQTSGSLTLKDVVLGYPSRVGVSASRTNVELIDVRATGFGTEAVPIYLSGDANGDYTADGTYSTRIVGGTFTDNHVSSIMLNALSASIEGTTFSGNSAKSGADVVAWGDGAQSLDLIGITSVGASAVGVLEEEGVGGSVVTGNMDVYVKDSSFEGCTAVQAGGAVAVFTDETRVSSSAVIEGGSITNCSASAGGAVVAENMQLTVTGTSFSNNWAKGSGGAIAVSNGSYDIADAALKGNWAGEAGGAIVIIGAGGTVARSSVIGPTSGRAAIAGGGIGLYYAAATLDDVSFANLIVQPDTDGDALGAAVYADSSDLLVFGHGHDTFVNLWAPGGGAIAAVSSSVLLDDVVGRDLGALVGGGVLAYDSDVTVERSRFERFEGSYSGALLTSVATSSLHLANNRICGMIASEGASVVEFDAPVRGWVDVHNNAFVGGRATDGIVKLLRADYPGGTTSIVNNTFAWNFPLRADVVIYDSGADVRNNLFTGAPAGVAVDATVYGASGGYNLYFGNVKATDDPNGWLTGEGDVRGDPLLFGASADGCDADLHLQWGSPARDAGDPDPFYEDGDGSRGDIGAFGGPDGGIVDLDGDGAPSEVDCDDLDGAVRPGADEVPYDGVDQDCAGGDACDQDGDGFAAAVGACGGDDCDDGDLAIFPGAVEAIGDDVDQNCDGADAKTWIGGGGGCGCTSAGGLGGTWIALLALAAVPWRRRTGEGCVRRADGG